MPEKASLQVIFYKTATGKAPVLEWLRDLDAIDRRAIGLDLLRVQENWPIGMPVCKSMGGGLWEVRSTLAGGRAGRLMFCLDRGDVVVLHGFMKTTQKTSKVDLELAQRRMKEVLK